MCCRLCVTKEWRVLRVLHIRKVSFSINVVETHCRGYEYNKYTGMLFLAPNVLTHIGCSPLAINRSWQTDISFGMYNQRIVFQFLAGAGDLSSPYGRCRLWVSCVWNTVSTASVFPEQRGRNVNLTTHLRLIPKLRMNRVVFCFPRVSSSLAQGRIYVLAIVKFLYSH